MAKQELDFYVNLHDTDEREDADAIQPIIDREPVAASVFNRPNENLRNRSEVVRAAVEGNNYRSDSVPYLIFAGDAQGAGSGVTVPGVNWNSTTGKFTVDSDLVLAPLASVSSDMQEMKGYSFYHAPADSCTVNLTTTRFAYSLANIQRVIWQEDAPANIPNGVCMFEVSGSPYHILTITIANDDSCLQSNLEAYAIGAGATALSTVGLAMSFGGTATCVLRTSGTPDELDYTFSKTYDKVVHHVPASTITDFFASSPSPSHDMAEGDTLAIAYTPGLVEDGGIGGNRQSIPSNSNTTKLHGQLFITSDYPEKVPFCVPICRRVGDLLYFIDGSVVYPSGTFSGVTTQKLDVSLWVLDTLANTTGGSSGASQIGVAAYTDPSPLSPSPLALLATDLQATLESMTRRVNKMFPINEDVTYEQTLTMDGGAQLYWAEDCQQQALSEYYSDEPTLFRRHFLGIDRFLSSGAVYTSRYRGPRVLEGMFVLPYQTDGSADRPAYRDSITVSPGVAVIQGREFILQEKTVVSSLWDRIYTAGTKTEIGTNLGGRNVTTYMFLYLRRDGVFRASLTSPKALSSVKCDKLWEDTNAVGGPMVNTGLGDLPEAGFAESDYAFCDVFWHIQGNTNGASAINSVYATGFMRPGGDYYAWPTVRYLDSAGNGADFFTHTLYYAALTDPGIPINSVEEIDLYGKPNTTTDPGTPGCIGWDYGSVYAPDYSNWPLNRRKMRLSLSLETTETGAFRVFFAFGNQINDAGSLALGGTHPNSTKASSWSQDALVAAIKMHPLFTHEMSQGSYGRVFTFDFVPGRKFSSENRLAAHWYLTPAGGVTLPSDAVITFNLADLGFYFNRDHIDLGTGNYAGPNT